MYILDFFLSLTMYISSIFPILYIKNILRRNHESYDSSKSLKNKNNFKKLTPITTAIIFLP